MRARYLFLLLLWGMPLLAMAQATLKGQLLDERGEPVYGVVVSEVGTSNAVSTDVNGRFSISLPSDRPVTVKWEASYIETQTQAFTLSAGEVREVALVAQPNPDFLEEVEIIETRPDPTRGEAGMIEIDPTLPQTIPSAFGDFNTILFTLPGVQSASELSGQYAVRGGNYDENLIYVNDLPVYKPFLSRTGEQEGLSFVNPSMVSQVKFSAGGWQPRYGDKLSSVLAVDYLRPEAFLAKGNASLLGGGLTVGSESKNEKFTYLVGLRHNRATYLLNTLQTQGEYRPTFWDFQSYLTYRFSDTSDAMPDRTELALLTTYARNRYSLEPTSRETTFGTFDNVLRLNVAFEGNELAQYDTYQSTLKLTHRFTEDHKGSVSVLGVRSFEREFRNVEAFYRLCELDPTGGANNCLNDRDLGSEFNYARNRLQVDVIGSTYRGHWDIDTTHTLEYGGEVTYETVTDVLGEYSFTDSSGFTTPQFSRFQNHILNTTRTAAYVQHRWAISEQWTATYGLRTTYWTGNGQWLVSPRVQLSYKPLSSQRDVVYTLGAGHYAQPPFYRELRNRDGVLNPNVKAQQSAHLILGRDQQVEIWDRPFRFIAEGYAKYLWDVNPYEVTDVRIRYYANNLAEAFAMGADFRLSGEFIEGEPSWFGLGILTTREDIEGDGRSWIRRPSDQRVTFTALYQDYFPDDPTWKVALTLVFGTGLPFGPPGSEAFRSALQQPTYRRVDIAFAKLLASPELSGKSKTPTVWLRAEVLNLLGVSNTISYLWVQDVGGTQYAVPNRLSQRFVNLRLSVEL